MLSDKEIHLHTCHPDDTACPDAVRVIPAGDADGDGAADLLLEGFPEGGTWFIPGTDLAEPGLYDSKLVGTTPVVRVLLAGAGPAAGLGDLDGDGYGEVLVAGGAGEALLLVGPHAACEGGGDTGGGGGVDVTAANHSFEGFSSGDLVVGAPGDLDGDGVPDLLLGEAGGEGSRLWVVLAADLATVER
jgi:hypothetical protein